jgi:hypothetical protein
VSEIIVNAAEQQDPKMLERERVSHEVTETIHSASRIAETAIMSDDPKVKEALKASVRVLLDTALTKLDESVGASEADQQMDEDE